VNRVAGSGEMVAVALGPQSARKPVRFRHHSTDFSDGNMGTLTIRIRRVNASRNIVHRALRGKFESHSDCLCTRA
jgi:hypothetical protein